MDEHLATQQWEEGSAATEEHHATPSVAGAAAATTATTTSVVEGSSPMLSSSPDKQQDAHNDNKNKDVVGGTSDTPAFCLLDGFLLQQDNKGSSMDDDQQHHQQRQRIRVPIVRLPAVLGRTHGSASAAGAGESSSLSSSNKGDPHFVALGKIKALSRHHVRIEYRTPHGTLGQKQKQQKAGDDDDDKKFVFEPIKEPDELLGNSEGEQRKTDDEGSYVITCLGKNRIFVNKQRLDPGQSAILTSGTALRIASLGLYFFLPKEKSKTTMQVELPSSSSSPKKKRKQPVTTTAVPAMKKTMTHKKPKKKTGATTGGGGAGSAAKTMQAEIDAMSTDDLLEQVADAIESNTWERRHQLIGSTIGSRAVVEAARDPDIQRRAQENGGVSRSEIMDWIADSVRFGEWVTQMLGKLEDKSYQASITKALIKMGFVRTASTGRYIKWLLPTNIYKDKGAAATIATSSSTTKTEAKDAGDGAEKEKDSSGDEQNDNEEASQSANGGSGDEEEEESEQEDGGSEKSDGDDHDGPEDEDEKQESNVDKEAVSDGDGDEV